MAAITKEQIAELSTIYWWLRGFLNVPVGEPVTELMKRIETNLPMDYLDTLATVVNDHSEKKAIEAEEAKAPAPIKLPEGDFDFDDHGNCEECEAG